MDIYEELNTHTILNARQLRKLFKSNAQRYLYGKEFKRCERCRHEDFLFVSQLSPITYRIIRYCRCSVCSCIMPDYVMEFVVSSERAPSRYRHRDIYMKLSPLAIGRLTLLTGLSFNNSNAWLISEYTGSWREAWNSTKLVKRDDNVNDEPNETDSSD